MPQLIEAEELLQLPCFNGILWHASELNRGRDRQAASPARRIICREGEFGSTAFICSKARPASRFRHHRACKDRRRGARVFKRLTSTLAVRDSDAREEETRDTATIPIDASVDLAYETRRRARTRRSLRRDGRA